MSFKADLRLSAEPTAWPALEFHWAIVQNISEQMRPEKGLYAGQIHLVLDHLHHPVLDDWMSEAEKLLDGSLIVLAPDGSRFREVQFWNAYCVGEGLYFNATGTGRAATMSVLISAQRIVVNGEVDIANHWPHLK